jgi:hypothetical protein
MRSDILFVFDELVANCLLGVRGHGTESGDTIDDVGHEVKAIEIIHHHHVERRHGGPFFFEAAHMQIFMVGAAIGEPLNQPRIAVVGEDNRLVGGEQRVEITVTQAVGVLTLRLKFQQVDHVHHSDLQGRKMLAQQL